MMIKNSITLIVATTVFMAGCSAMLPYRDNFQCERGKNNGVCASISEVYEMSFNMDELKKERLNQEKKGCGGECGGKEVKKENIDKPIENDINSSIENQRLREIVEAIEIKKLQDGRPIVIQNNSVTGMDTGTKQNIQKMVISKMASQTGANKAVSEEVTQNTTNGDDVIHTLNQDVKDEVLYAEYEKKGWVKTDDGYIHKSIITKK